MTFKCGKCNKVAFPENNGEGRQNTDRTCCIIYLLTLVATGAIYAWSIFHGNTLRLVHGFDHKGNLCGHDPEVADKPFLYYCGHNQWDDQFPKNLAYYSKSCVSKCPTDASVMVPCLTRALVNFTSKGNGTEDMHGSMIYFVNTLNMDMTQSVAYQKGYPSENYRGNYCVPKLGISQKGDELRVKLVDGPLRRLSRFSSAIGSFRQVWWLIVIFAVLAAILGLGYLWVLQYYAGVLIYLSLWVGTVMMFLLSLFFIYGIFPDPMDEEGWYQNLSPVFRLCYGWEARGWSLIIALLLGGAGTCMLFNTLNQNIDESIGIVKAATDCMFFSMTTWLQPIFGGGFIMAVVGALFWGYMLGSTVLEKDPSLIVINGSALDNAGQPIKGLEARWLPSTLWDAAMYFYIFAMIWTMLLCLAASQFVIAFSVCDYYFAKGTLVRVSSSANQVLSQGLNATGKKIDHVRVHGVDAVPGARSGYAVKQGGHQFLVVPIGQRGPDGRDFPLDLQDHDELQKSGLQDPLRVSATGAALGYHLGSLALGAIVITITSPMRIISMIIKSIIANNRDYLDEETKTPSGILIGGLGLMSSFIDEFFGCYSKALYTEIVLTSMGFWEAAMRAPDFVAESGGVVQLLHGATALYEMIGVLVITAICSLGIFLVLTKVAFFANNEEVDPIYMTLLSGAISLFISAGFMSLFHITCDSLLYVFAFSLDKHQDCLIDTDKKDGLCPTPLYHLVEGMIKDTEPLQPHSRNRLTRYSHAAVKYRDTLLKTVGWGKETKPLLPTDDED